MATVNKNTKSQLGKGMAALLGSGAAPIGTNDLEKKLEKEKPSQESFLRRFR